MARHSTLVERYKEKFQPVREQFRKYVEERVAEFGGGTLAWEGDGGIAVFWSGADFVERAVWAGLSVISDMYLFNLRFNPFPEFVDVRVGVHRGTATAEDDPGNWYGDGLNKAGKFIKLPLTEGRISITQPVFQSLNLRTRARFHQTGAFNRLTVYEFTREMLDPSLELLVRFIESKRFLDIQNEAGDTVIEQEIVLTNASPFFPIEELSWNLGHDESPMSWSDCNVQAWDTSTGKRIEILPIHVDDPLFKVWRFRFPPVDPGQRYSLTYAAKWNRMFPVPGEPPQWLAKIPTLIEIVEIRIACPPGFKPKPANVRLLRYVDPADKKEIKADITVVKPEESRSKKWEILLKLVRPKLFHFHELDWDVERE